MEPPFSFAAEIGAKRIFLSPPKPLG